MPRPVAFRAEMRRAVLDALHAGSTYRDACVAAGIPWSTWMKWRRVFKAKGEHPDPDVTGLILEAEQAYARATNSITAQVRVAASKDWRAAAFLLDHRRGDPKARHDERRARWEAEVAAKRAKGEHREQVAVDASDELVERLRKALHGGDR
jgi:hypothetical protein